jgi:23S rRNA (guanosine2251-2'-O)-methyltransferase
MNPYKPKRNFDTRTTSVSAKPAGVGKPAPRNASPVRGARPAAVGGRTSTVSRDSKNAARRRSSEKAKRPAVSVDTLVMGGLIPGPVLRVKKERILRPVQNEIIFYGKHVVDQLIRSYPGALRFILARVDLVDGYREMGQKYGTHCPIHTGDDIELGKKSHNGFHQGVVAVIAHYPYVHISDIPEDAKSILVLDQLQDPQNVGALIRSANAFGFQAVILCEHEQVGITATVARASAGTVFQMPIVQVTNISKSLDRIKERGFWVAGLAGDRSDAVNIVDYDFSDKVAIVVGSEGEGLRPGVQNHCDTIISIPIADTVESLNASVAGAIAMYQASKVNK